MLEQLDRPAGNLVDILSGEYGIVSFDNSTKVLQIITDPFLTKPVFIGRGHDPSEIGVASYASALHQLGFTAIHCAQPNTFYRINFAATSLQISERFPVFNYTLNQQEKNYDRWTEAFVEAVRRRATHGAHEPLVCLSSGYDSGGIALALNLLNIPYRTISILAGEQEKILRQRVQINALYCKESMQIPGITKSEQERIRSAINTVVEPLPYSHFDNAGQVTRLSDDGGAIGLYAIAEHASGLGTRVSLSGSGADEIMSDYGNKGLKLAEHSEFGGLFPARLEGFFPWKKFYGDTQRSYLFKEEYILGSQGMEGRYPYLDRDLVQEFLSLDPALKNKEYKAPLTHFLRTHNYPFEPETKRGFSAGLPSRWKRFRRLFKS